MMRRVDQEQRHFRLSILNDWESYEPEDIDVKNPRAGKTREELRSMPPEDQCQLLLEHARKTLIPGALLLCRTLAAGVTQLFTPPRMNVLDVDRIPSRLWYEYACPARRNVPCVLRHEWAQASPFRPTG